MPVLAAGANISISTNDRDSVTVEVPSGASCTVEYPVGTLVGVVGSGSRTFGPFSNRFAVRLTAAGGAVSYNMQDGSNSARTQRRYLADWGVVGGSSNDQTSAILRARDDAIAEAFCGELVFPAGLVPFTGPIDWSGCGRQGAFYYEGGAGNWIQPPALVGSNLGVTKLKMINAIGNTTGMIFSVTDAMAATGLTRIRALRFSGIEFEGPGTSVQRTTLSATANAGTTFSCTNAVGAIGDAVAIINGNRRHWATVTNVSGGGPQTITIDTRQAILSAFLTAGTTVLFFKQTRLLQIGGTRTAASVINSDTLFDQCSFTSAFQGVCLDDSLKNTFDKCLWKNVVQKVCFGFQVDTTIFQAPYAGSDFPLVSATCTNNSRVVTVANPLITQVGMKLWESPNANGTLNLPEHTYIESVVGSTVTLSELYTGTTGAKTLNAGSGPLICSGQGGHAFLPACPANTINNTNSVTLIEPKIARIEKLWDCSDALTVGVNCIGGYVESCQRIMTNGQLGGSGSGGPYVFSGIFVQDPGTMVGPAFEELAGGVSVWDLKVLGVAPAKYPLLSSRNSSIRAKFPAGWSWVNNSTAALGYSQTSPPTIDLDNTTINGVVNIRQGQEWSYNVGRDGFSPCEGAGIVHTAFTGALNWNWPGINALDLTLIGNLTAGSIVGGVPPRGYEVRITLKQDATGGRTATLGGGTYGTTDWIRGDGTALPAIAAGTSGQALIMDFVSNGAKMVLQGNQTLAFI